jgi:hypothetical protein
MHTRRLGAFLTGAWLLGSFLMAFVTAQSLVNVERIIKSPPPVAAPDVTRQILRHGAHQLNRHLVETWEVIQFGIGGALLAVSFLTPYRSRFLIIGTILMLLMVFYLHFGMTPRMNELARLLDFHSAADAVAERETYNAYVIRYQVLEILKSIAGVIIAGRLVLDRQEWKSVRRKLVQERGVEPLRPFGR